MTLAQGACPIPKAIFVSYSHEDRAFVDRLLKALSDAVDDQFTFLRDAQSIGAGDDITTTIGSLIEQSDGLLAIVPRREDSSWFSAEIAIGLAKSTRDPLFRLIPIVLHEASVPYLLRDRLYVSFSDPSRFSINVSSIAKALLADVPHTTDIDAEAIRKASIDAKRAFLEMTKAQHTIQKANEVRSVALAVTASVISVVATATPWVFAKGLTYNQLGSSLIGLLMLMVGFAFGRFSKRHRENGNGLRRLGKPDK